MKCDLHCHTLYSNDSNCTIKSIIDQALKKGINCLAICDHGEIKGAKEAQDYAHGKPIIIIPSIELKSKQGDILGLNIREKIQNKLSAKQTIQNIKKAGGLAIIAHPFDFKNGFRGNIEDYIDQVDGLEIWNAFVSKDRNQKAIDLAKKYNLMFTCGSDSHFKEFVGRAYLELPGENLTLEQVLEGIKNKTGQIKFSPINYFEITTTIIRQIKEHILHRIAG